MRRYAFQNWVYHFISDTNHRISVLDEVVQFIDTSLEEFGVWMRRVGSSKAAGRINVDLAALPIELQQIQHPGLQLKLQVVIRRVEVSTPFFLIVWRADSLCIL
jgi:hypothetical protein